MSDAAPPRIAVVGGGITGLAAAYRLIELSDELAQPADVTLYEASDRLGGVFGTQMIDGYMVETGADSFITNKPWAVNLCERLGLGDELIGTNETFRSSLILHEGRPVPTPEGFELLVPRKLRALLASPLLSMEGKLRAAAEAFVPAKTDDADESLAEFVRRRFGQEMLDRIVQPMVGGIYTSDPERLSMSATLPRFIAMERQYGSLLRAVWAQRNQTTPDASADDVPSGARYGLFATLAGGMSDLLMALERRLRFRCTIRPATPVTAVTPKGDGSFVVAAVDGSQQTFDAVLLAVPAYVAAELVSPWDFDLSASLRGIEYASSAIVVTGHRLADVSHPLDAFGLVIPHCEGRRVLAVSFLSRKFPDRAPKGYVQLRTFVGGAMQPELLEQDDESLIRMVREELQATLGVEGEPTFSLVARYDRAMPQYHVGHRQRVAAIEAAAAKHPTIALAGNAYYGVGLPDAVHSGELAAERAFHAIPPASPTRGSGDAPSGGVSLEPMPGD